MQQVPEQCPASIAALIKECMRPKPAERPTAKEIFDRMQVWQPGAMHVDMASGMCLCPRVFRVLEGSSAAVMRAMVCTWAGQLACMTDVQIPTR